ncbi:MAG: Na+/H+ antiporter NhaC [Bacteroidetes bacterium]|jgi:NhaC family Na+:H+ antiporter|nr:Na+/H+ antiporter NhaC [Bacteroidota bacterium]
MSLSKPPTVMYAAVPILTLIGLLVLNVLYFGADASYGPNQIALLLAASVAGLLAYRQGLQWNDIMEGILKSINHAMPSILILLLIGALAGTWLISGIVPAMIYYGLNILTPKVFLLATCLVCMVVSTATGSSWSTAATVGVALMGVGQALQVHPGLVAGAIISGAYFGDKMSPLSDTTNLAPAMAGTDLFTHIRAMTATTIPSMVIALVLFAILGFTRTGQADQAGIDAVQQAISQHFNISPMLFVVPAVVIFLIVRKVPALPALLVGVLLGAAFAVVFQGWLGQAQLLESISPLGEGYATWERYFSAITLSMYGEVGISSDNEVVTGLLKAKGMMGMMFVILLVITAMVFGGVMESAHFLQVLVEALIKKVQGTTSLVTATVGSCIFFNLTASEQYVSIVVPGRMFSDVYARKGLPPQLLSRSLEDAGTVTSVLVPWNSCGAYHHSVLGVNPLMYLPYCFFNLISPFMSIFITYLAYRKKPWAK